MPRVEACLFSYQCGLVLMCDSIKIILLDNETNEEKQEQFLQLFDRAFQISTLKKHAIIFGKCEMLKLIHGTTHWLQMDKITPKLVDSGNKLFVMGIQYNSGQIKYEDAQFMAKIDEYYYFYSNNICYQTDENFFIIEQKSVNFPFYVRQQHQNFRMFDNDYPQWFVTSECNGRHFSNVYDMLYEFKPFETIPLTVIPEYPINHKQNHKVLSIAGLLLVTNGHDIFEYIDNTFKIISNTYFNCNSLRLHEINGQILVRDNINRNLYTLGLNYELLKIEENFRNSDLIVANKNYIINYNDKYCVTYCQNQILTHMNTSISSQGDDIKRINYILNNGEWDISQQTFTKILGAKKDQIFKETIKFQNTQVPESILKISEQFNFNKSFIMYSYFVLQNQLFIPKYLHSGIVKLILIDDKKEQIKYLVENCDIKLSYKDFTKVFKCDDVENYIKVVDSQENINQLFQNIDTEEIENFILEKTEFNLKYISFCIVSLKQSSLVNKYVKIHINEIQPQQLIKLMDEAIHANNIEYVTILSQLVCLNSINTRHCSPEVAQIIASVSINKEISKTLKHQQYYIIFSTPPVKIQSAVYLCDYVHLTKLNIPCELVLLPFIIYFKEQLKINYTVNGNILLPAHLKKLQQNQINKLNLDQDESFKSTNYVSDNTDNYGYDDDYTDDYSDDNGFDDYLDELL
ncbi:Conserved_hypothetical protein [Hexamita inflata]|uniref:Uncharacterized protein n=1 Tax=Hexamita inflata TaxID=28002 RepID=A0AA86Q411_9EUKA|nr:Conserved hypothetical protein [Hexamita inflata]